MPGARPFRFAVQAFSADSAEAWRSLARRTEAWGYSALHLADHFLGPGEAITGTNHPVQGLAAVPHGDIFEYCMTDSPLRHDITNEKFEVIDGYVSIPEGPGLGVTINEKTIEKYRVA